MKRAVPIIFVNSFGSAIIERGIYFMAREGLHFSDQLNLWLALVYGAMYVGGAVISHGITARLGERRSLIGVSLAQIGVLALVTVHCTTVTMFAATAALSITNGFKWPILVRPPFRA